MKFLKPFFSGFSTFPPLFFFKQLFRRNVGFLFLALFFSPSILGQSSPWHPIPDSLPSLYYNDSVAFPGVAPWDVGNLGPVLGVDIDSSKNLGNKRVDFFTPVLTSKDPSACLQDSAGLMGWKMIQKNEKYCFLNAWRDSIFLKPNKEVGQKWPVYVYDDQDTLYGEVSDKNWTEVLGEKDSVKTITLERIDAVTGKTVPWANIAQYPIKIGKEFGLVEFPAFNLFPKDTGTFVIKKRGLFTRREIFDFRKGEEFHFGYSPSYVSGIPYYFENKRVEKRENFPQQDSVSYTFLIQKYFYRKDSNEIQKKTKGYGELSKPFIKALPHEKVERTSDFPDGARRGRDSLMVYSMSKWNCNKGWKIFFGSNIFVLSDSSSSYNYCPSAATKYSFVYSPSLGRIKRSFFLSGESPPYERKELLYYQTPTGDTCGNPVPLINDNEASKNNQMGYAYPNPFTDSFKLGLPEKPNYLAVVSENGKLINEWSYEKQESQPNRVKPWIKNISLSNYPSGIYFVNAVFSEGGWIHEGENFDVNLKVLKVQEKKK